MTFWKPTKTKKKGPRPLDTGQAVPARKKIHRSSPVVFEAKMLAIEAVNCGADCGNIVPPDWPVCDVRASGLPDTLENSGQKRPRHFGQGPVS